MKCKLLQRTLVICAFVLALTMDATGQSARPAAGPRDGAIALEQQGRTVEAISAWQSIAKKYPGNAEAYAHLGVLLAHEERYQEAIAAYRRASQLQPAMPGLRMNLALAYLKGGNLKLAVATLQPLLDKVPPGTPEAVRLKTLIGLAEYGMGNDAAAIPYLKAATDADPQNLQFRMYLGQSCLRTKQYPCVLDVYREILALNAESPQADMLAGEAYDELKNEGKALEEFQAAAVAGPHTPDVHFACGYLLWRMLRYDEASKEFKAELENNPDHALALTYLADIEIRAGHTDAARPYLERAIKLQPSIALAHLDLGTVFQAAGRNDDAVRELKEAERLSPKDAKVHWQLGRYYQSAGRTAEARAELEKAKTLQDAADQSVVDQLNQTQASERGAGPGK